MQKHKDTIEWAAGIFEAEGNIYRNDRKGLSYCGHIFVISVKMKDEDVVKRFHSVVKVGRVKARKIKQPYNYPFLIKPFLIS